MNSRTSFWVLIIFLILSFIPNEAKTAAVATPVSFEWIDDDGTVVPIEWQSETAWSWDEKKFELQVWFEIPKHLLSTIPASLSKKIVAASTRPSFKLSPDHVLLNMHLRKPVELLKFDETRNRILRVSALTTKTTWMRHANCKDANPYLESSPDTTLEHGPFFISIFCVGRETDDTAWVEVETSTEAVLKIVTNGKVQQKGNALLLPMPSPGSKDSKRSAERKLAVLEFTDVAGDALGSYELNASPEPPPAPEPVQVMAPLAQITSETKTKLLTASMGLHAQLLSSTRYVGTVTSEGRSAAEFAISLNSKIQNFVVDLELPVRRLGAGLDTGHPADHIAWLFAGHRMNQDVGYKSTVALGAQATLLDSRPKIANERVRTSTTSISPAVQLGYRDRYFFTLAPLDLQSQLASARARFQIPLPKNDRYAVAVEGFWGRTLGSGDKGWDVIGAGVGFTGAF